MTVQADINALTGYDDIINQIVNYVYDYDIQSDAAWSRAITTLLDALGVAVESITTSTECASVLGPILPAPQQLPNGFRLPGTSYQLDILKGAFDMGTVIRYLDHNDAFPGAEWGHPSDNLGAILATADVCSRVARSEGRLDDVLTMKHVLTALIKAYEIQGVFQIKNAFNQVGLDHVILVKISATAVVSWLLGLTKDAAKAAVSHAWADGHPLRVYRQAPNTGPRKGWAAGDACMRAVHLALLGQTGQPGIRSALTAPKWGFYHVLFRGNQFDLPRPFGTWVVETVAYKIDTAEGHAITAAEAAWEIANQMKERGLTAADIDHIHVRTQRAAMIIINKEGDLHNPADRDHCLRYIVSVILLKGDQILTEDYQNNSPWATDPRVNDLRKRIHMEEDPQMTKDYHDPQVRSVSNAIQVTLKDGTQLDEVRIDFPKGHARRPETAHMLRSKAKNNLALGFSEERVEQILDTFQREDFAQLPVYEVLDLFAV
ncbi:putative 2-methylcitrate dehydratase [Aspergillus avenaceus]|uniref:Putative 2-methylcitrate dehydratase n=1 Tax=Aspergillus avenaceus TaxID=36643 RepID=A0A5N6U5L1_ASPAV|nr:putative 2-methylcitrate dehydratase [Aspergillus avenaceus]